MNADLSKTTLFRGLPAADLQALAGRVTPRTLPADSVVFSEGDPGDSLYLILSGKVKICLHDANGKEFIVDVRNAGGYVGEMMLDGSPRSATVEATTGMRLLVIGQREFWALVATAPQITRRIMSALSQRIREANAAYSACS